MEQNVKSFQPLESAFIVDKICATNTYKTKVRKFFL